MPNRQTLKRTAIFECSIYSPKGGIEGAIVDIDGARVQLTFKHAPQHEGLLARCNEGDELEVAIKPQPKSHMGEAAHPVYELHCITALRASDVAGPAATSGVIARLNYALHGEPNGVVLDNGDFVHLRPEGMRQLDLAVGAQVVAGGHGMPMRFGKGRVIEATHVNDQALSHTPKSHDHKPHPSVHRPYRQPPH